MPVKRFFRSVFFTLCFIFFLHGAYGDEVYYIDNTPLFLYKTINWWYDCLPGESGKLCGRPIKCSNVGNAQVDYDEPGRNLELKIKGGFATMLSAFKNCEQCYGPSYLHCTWRNKKYLENTTVSVLLNDAAIIGGIFFRNIEKHQAQQIRGMEHDLQFILEGVIGGLSDGRVSLHQSGSLLKKCGGDSERQDQKYPITLRVVNMETNEIIAKFSMFWER